jgi:hypothetical protein
LTKAQFFGRFSRSEILRKTGVQKKIRTGEEKGKMYQNSTVRRDTIMSFGYSLVVGYGLLQTDDEVTPDGTVTGLYRCRNSLRSHLIIPDDSAVGDGGDDDDLAEADEDAAADDYRVEPDEFNHLAELYSVDYDEADEARRTRAYYSPGGLRLGSRKLGNDELYTTDDDASAALAADRAASRRNVDLTELRFGMPVPPSAAASPPVPSSLDAVPSRKNARIVCDAEWCDRRIAAVKSVQDAEAAAKKAAESAARKEARRIRRNRLARERRAAKALRQG